MRFPDGSRREVERVLKRDAPADLDALLVQRAEAASPEPVKARLATFNEVGGASG